MEPSLPSTPGRVPRSLAWILGLGLVAASQSGNLVRLATAPALAIVAWRLLIAAALLAPWVGSAGWAALRGLRWRSWGLLLAGAAALALHLGFWVAAVQQTTVARAMIFFATNPLFTALAAVLLFKERLTLRLGLSVGLGLAGVAVMGWRELGLEAARLQGDLLALAGAMGFSVYFLVGKRLRQELPSRAYLTLLYGGAGVLCLPALALSGGPVVEFSGWNWFCFLLMALIPTLIGHSSFNHALRWLAAGRVAASTLVEPLLAGVVAWVAWGEPLGPATWLGYALVVASILVLLSERWGAPRGIEGPRQSVGSALRVE